MTPAAARAMYRRQIKNGETVTLTRGATSVSVRAKPSNNAPSELVGAIDQRDRFFIVLYDELVAADFPVPPAKGDRLTFAGNTLAVQAVDQATRRVAGEQIAYDIVARGM